jgi:hypothetical protein
MSAAYLTRNVVESLQSLEKHKQPSQELTEKKPAPHVVLGVPPSKSSADATQHELSSSMQVSTDHESKTPDDSQARKTPPESLESRKTSANENKIETEVSKDNSEKRLIKDLLVLEQMMSEMREGVWELKKVMGVPSVTDERLHEVGGVCMLKIFMY